MEKEKTEDEILAELKERHSAMVEAYLGAGKNRDVFYIVLPGTELGFVLKKDISMDTYKKVSNMQAYHFMNPSKGVGLVDAGEMIFEECLIPGAIDQKILESRYLLADCYMPCNALIEELKKN